MRAAAFLLLLGACDPVWGAQVQINGPDRRPIENAMLAVACPDGVYRSTHMAVRTKPDGTGFVGSVGGQFPVGCDVFIAKPGYRTHQIKYRDLCPGGPAGCARVFHFDLVLEPE